MLFTESTSDNSYYVYYDWTIGLMADAGQDRSNAPDWGMSEDRLHMMDKSNYLSTQCQQLAVLHIMLID